MQLPQLCIRRPVLTIVMNLLIVLAGLLAFDRLTIREYPNIDIPTVTVDTTYTGASAAIIESTVTKLLEDSLSGIEGIDYLSSSSRSGRSQITLAFKPDREIESATSDVRDRVSRIRGKLPQDINEPVITKTEADAQPIIWLAFRRTGTRRWKSIFSPTSRSKAVCKPWWAYRMSASSASDVLRCASGWIPAGWRRWD